MFEIVVRLTNRLDWANLIQKPTKDSTSVPQKKTHTQLSCSDNQQKYPLPQFLFVFRHFQSDKTIPLSHFNHPPSHPSKSHASVASLLMRTLYHLVRHWMAFPEEEHIKKRAPLLLSLGNVLWHFSFWEMLISGREVTSFFCVSVWRHWPDGCFSWQGFWRLFLSVVWNWKNCHTRIRPWLSHQGGRLTKSCPVPYKHGWHFQRMVKPPWILSHRMILMG